MRLEILYEDDHLIAINKPAGVLTVPDRFDQDIPNLKRMLLDQCGEIYVVHRLDRETSGTILFAKTSEAHKILNDDFSAGNVKKLYWALTIMPPDMSGRIEVNIAENERKKGTYIVAKKGRHSISEYRVIENFGKYALTEVEIFTGRTHQIRVHMRHIHAPLLVDNVYGAHEAFYLSEIKKYKSKKDQTERPLLSRCSLHARQLEITHPVTNEKLTINADLSKDMKAVLNQMRKIFS